MARLTVRDTFTFMKLMTDFDSFIVFGVSFFYGNNTCAVKNKRHGKERCDDYCDYSFFHLMLLCWLLIVT